MASNGVKIVCMAMACCALSCLGEAQPLPFEAIEAKRMAMPELFITEQGKQIRAPGNQGVFVDQGSREIAWPAYACDNPKCPGRKADGQPHLFSWRDPRFFVTPEGTLGTIPFATQNAWKKAVKSEGGQSVPTCPECLKTRHLSDETAEQQGQFAKFVRRYELPESIVQRAELNVQSKLRKAYDERRAHQK